MGKKKQNFFVCFFPLWQINRAPSFGTDQKIDYDVKKGVLLNALKLLNIRYCSLAWPHALTHSRTHTYTHIHSCTEKHTNCILGPIRLRVHRQTKLTSNFIIYYLCIYFSECLRISVDSWRLWKLWNCFDSPHNSVLTWIFVSKLMTQSWHRSCYARSDFLHRAPVHTSCQFLHNMARVEEM